MPDKQPVEDGSVIHVEQYLEVVLQYNLSSRGSLGQQGATGLAAREDDLVAEGFGEFALESAGTSVVAIWRPSGGL